MWRKHSFFTLCLRSLHSHLKDVQNSIDLSQLKHIRITNYKGRLDKTRTELLENIESLELKENNFTTVNEDFLWPLRNLKKLAMIKNKIQVEEGASLTESVQIKEIKFMNTLSYVVASEEWAKIGEMSGLEKITLHKERVPHLGENFVLNAHLKELNIEFCNLESIEPGAFDKITRLEYLNLRGNKISDICKECLMSQKYLKVINVEKNLVKELNTNNFPSLPNLEKIYIGHNPIKRIDLDGIKEIAPNLKQVDISGIDEIDLSRSGGVEFVKTF